MLYLDQKYVTSAVYIDAISPQGYYTKLPYLLLSYRLPASYLTILVEKQKDTVPTRFSHARNR